jgi:hypothetical protein
MFLALLEQAQRAKLKSVRKEVSSDLGRRELPRCVSSNLGVVRGIRGTTLVPSSVVWSHAHGRAEIRPCVVPLQSLVTENMAIAHLHHHETETGKQVLQSLLMNTESTNRKYCHVCSEK